MKSRSIFGSTVQVYVTPNCAMGCPHCGSKELMFSNMSLSTFELTLDVLKSAGVSRVELFANDPLLYPNIREFVGMLNASGLGYALLTTGSSPKDPGVTKLFYDVIDLIDPSKGGLVFSVDYLFHLTGEFDPYHFKANVYHGVARDLRNRGLPVRTNTVVSRNNVDSVPQIIRSVIEQGFAASLCFVQSVSKEFEAIFNAGSISTYMSELVNTLEGIRFIRNEDVPEIIAEMSAIVAAGPQFPSPFNCFRGVNRSEGDINPDDLQNLRQELLKIKAEFPWQLLPSESFISNLGDPSPFGCLELLEQGKFPQLKVGSRGEIKFCCDLHDPQCRDWNIVDLRIPEKQADFLQQVRKNPYILLCTIFNACDFSVNHVASGTQAKK